jgi:DeoR family fructose operon transcriptional repressor
MTQPREVEPVVTVVRSGGLFGAQRRERIMEIVLREGRVDVSELAGLFDVTGETIRRDLTDLQAERLVRRVHGGAVPWRGGMFVPALQVREGQNVEEKRRIGMAAAREVPEHGAVLIDSGSTAAHLADAFPRDRDLTVITNSIPIIQSLAMTERPRVVVIGGTLRRRTLAMVDEAGVEALRDITVDVLFIGCDGMSPQRGFTTPYRTEVAIKRAMMASAQRVVMMFDHSKVGNDQLFRFADIDEVDTVITDDGVEDAVATAIEEQGPAVIRV